MESQSQVNNPVEKEENNEKTKIKPKKKKLPNSSKGTKNEAPIKEEILKHKKAHQSKLVVKEEKIPTEANQSLDEKQIIVDPEVQKWKSSIDEYKKILSQILANGHDLVYPKKYLNEFPEFEKALPELIIFLNSSERSEEDKLFKLKSILAYIISFRAETISELITLCKGILSNIPINFNVNYEEAILAIAQRKGLRNQPNSIINFKENKDPDNLWTWQLVNASLITGALKKEYENILQQQNIVGSKIKSLTKVIDRIEKMKSNQNIAKVSKSLENYHAACRREDVIKQKNIEAKMKLEEQFKIQKMKEETKKKSEELAKKMKEEKEEAKRLKDEKERKLKEDKEEIKRKQKEEREEKEKKLKEEKEKKLEEARKAKEERERLQKEAKEKKLEEIKKNKELKEQMKLSKMNKIDRMNKMKMEDYIASRKGQLLSPTKKNDSFSSNNEEENADRKIMTSVDQRKITNFFIKKEQNLEMPIPISPLIEKPKVSFWESSSFKLNFNKEEFDSFLINPNSYSNVNPYADLNLNLNSNPASNQNNTQQHFKNSKNIAFLHRKGNSIKDKYKYIHIEKSFSSYEGWFNESSSTIGPKSPFSKDKKIIYEMDSEEEYEEKNGEDIKDSDNDKEEEESAISQLDDQFIVPDNYLSSSEQNNGSDIEEMEISNPVNLSNPNKIANESNKPNLVIIVGSNEKYNLEYNSISLIDKFPFPIDPFYVTKPSIPIDPITKAPKYREIEGDLLNELYHLIHGSYFSKKRLTFIFKDSHKDLPKKMISDKILESAEKIKEEQTKLKRFKLKDSLMKPELVEPVGLVEPLEKEKFKNLYEENGRISREEIEKEKKEGYTILKKKPKIISKNEDKIKKIRASAADHKDIASLIKENSFSKGTKDIFKTSFSNENSLIPKDNN